ncbi:hypothetical protein JTB14_022589 [Gonioctena quinquepunctata]|nr:hypothetical protein JTB14_022589 [Gonioctena quinquepunctata]
MTLTKRIIFSNDAPSYNSPFNQAVVLDNTIYVSGVLGVNKDTMKLVEGDFSTEMRQALRNLKAILEAGSSSLDKVVKVTVLMSDINNFGSMNEVYSEFFTEYFPARTTFVAAKLPLNARIEIEAIGAIGTVKTVCCR